MSFLPKVLVKIEDTFKKRVTLFIGFVFSVSLGNAQSTLRRNLTLMQGGTYLREVSGEKSVGFQMLVVSVNARLLKRVLSSKKGKM